MNNVNELFKTIEEISSNPELRISHNGHIDLDKMLEENKNCWNELLYIAISRNNLTIIRLLLSRGVDINKQDACC